MCGEKKIYFSKVVHHHFIYGVNHVPIISKPTRVM
jgi:hypothetical protein